MIGGGAGGGGKSSSLIGNGRDSSARPWFVDSSAIGFCKMYAP